MNLALVKETKTKEKRVALIPEHVKVLVDAGHNVYVEENAGADAGFSDQKYSEAGAKITSAEEAYRQPLIIRVKEPPPRDIKRKPNYHGLFTS